MTGSVEKQNVFQTLALCKFAVLSRIRELVRISHRTFGFCFSDVTYFPDVAVTEQRINIGITS